MKPRLGLPADAEAVATVMVNTMWQDPQWDYRFPYRCDYPDDHKKYTKMLIECFLDPSYDDWLVMVKEDVPGPGMPPQVVSFGVWNVSYVNKRLHGPSYTPQSRKCFYSCYYFATAFFFLFFPFFLLFPSRLLRQTLTVGQPGRRWTSAGARRGGM
jgi:hypothetical protein